MPDTVVKKRGGFLTWLALILAIAALVLAWLAYNRSGEDLEAKIQREVQRSVQDAADNNNTAPSPQPTTPTPQPSTQPEDNSNSTE